MTPPERARPTKVVTAEQMRLIEQRSEAAGVSTQTLMANAGLAVAKRVQFYLDRVEGARVMVLVGPGNNGGDGLVAAHHLQRWGSDVAVYLCADRRDDDPNLSQVREGNSRTIQATEDQGLERLHEEMGTADIVLDAVLGTGRSRPMADLIQEIFGGLAAARADRPELRLVALDLPSGLDADSGAVDAVCPPADVTIATGYPKVGLFEFPGASYTGSVETVGIGLPPRLDDDVNLGLMTPEWAAAALPERPASGHKGTFGRTLIVAGSREFIGAAHLAASAAGRVGAGLVTLATPESLLTSVAALAAEPTHLPLPESAPGVPSPNAADLILERARGYHSLLVGCGMGQAPSTRDMLTRLLLSGAPLPPTVVDADALNFLASSERNWWKEFPTPAIVTPHPGEMARLTGMSTEEVQKARVPIASDAAAMWNKVTVLKGAHTVVTSPGGDTLLSPFANPGLATAGTGDVLAGAISGLMAQGLSLEDSAALGVYLHGAAAELAREELGDTGMLAGDLLIRLPRAIKGLKERATRRPQSVGSP